MAKDIFHETVRQALEKDGWEITHDPYPLQDKERAINYFVDLGAEKLLAAQKDSEKIAIEIKSFVKDSLTHEFHSVLGQYLTYLTALKHIDTSRVLYLAIPDFAYFAIKKYSFIEELIVTFGVKLLVYSPEKTEILSWKK